MPARNSNQPHSEANGGRESTAEQARLDEAIRRADDLLVSSLKGDDRRRARRKIVWGGIFVVLGLMVAVMLISSKLGFVRLDSSALAGDREEKAAELSAEGWKLWQAISQGGNQQIRSGRPARPQERQCMERSRLGKFQPRQFGGRTERL
jgi:hypothetical protein